MLFRLGILRAVVMDEAVVQKNAMVLLMVRVVADNVRIPRVQEQQPV